MWNAYSSCLHCVINVVQTNDEKSYELEEVNHCLCWFADIVYGAYG